MVNDINWNSKWKWYGCEYHVQNKEDVNYADVKRSCENTQFPALQFTGTSTKYHGVWVLSKHYNL